MKFFTVLRIVIVLRWRHRVTNVGYNQVSITINGGTKMGKPNLQLTLQTTSLILGFMVWVILSSLMTFIKADIPLTPGDIAIITAIPVILGSIVRIPLGHWTNKYGARITFLISFILLLLPVFLISLADSKEDLMIGGLLLGIGGAVFSIGVTSLPKYYPKEKHGLINGIYGMGNMGSAISTFAAPVIASSIGWRDTVRMYLILLALFALLHFIFGDRREKKSSASLMEQIKGVYKKQKLWFLCICYFLTFGVFVAFTVYLPNFLVTNFDLTKVSAGMRTAGFIALATLMRPIGGWLGDKFNPFKILIFVFGGLTLSGVILAFNPDLMIYTIGCLLIAFSAGIGNGAVFKLVPMYFAKQGGIVNGLVSAIGGLGGFFPPLLLAFLLDKTGSYAIGFMALSEIALACLILTMWMFYQDKLQLSASVIDSTIEGIMVTDLNGIIQEINPSFSKVTGYSKEEVIGKKPNILSSGKQSRQFYEKMWIQLKKKGQWNGSIWNKRRNGEVYEEWLTISAICNEAGDPISYVGMFSDLSTKN